VYFTSSIASPILIGFRIGIGIGKSMTCRYTNGRIYTHGLEKAIATCLAIANLDGRFLEEMDNKVRGP
jgi:hypothetical protein